MARGSGLPRDVAALVEKLTADSATLTLVNVNQTEERTMMVQAGGYAEHSFVAVQTGELKHPVNATHFTVRLAPGAGARLRLHMRRHVHQPVLAFPWDRAIRVSR
jgi:hypothetical protein